MIEVPIWIFIMLLVGFGLFVSFMIFGLVQLIHDKIIDYVEWKTNYKKYKDFWDDNPDLR